MLGISWLAENRLASQGGGISVRHTILCPYRVSHSSVRHTMFCAIICHSPVYQWTDAMSPNKSPCPMTELYSTTSWRNEMCSWEREMGWDEMPPSPTGGSKNVSLPGAVLCQHRTLTATVFYSTPCSLCFCVLGHLSNRGSFPSKDNTSVFSIAVVAWRKKGGGGSSCRGKAACAWNMEVENMWRYTSISLYRVILSLEVPNYCL